MLQFFQSFVRLLPLGVSTLGREPVGTVDMVVVQAEGVEAGSHLVLGEEVFGTGLPVEAEGDSNLYFVQFTGAYSASCYSFPHMPPGT